MPILTTTKSSRESHDRSTKCRNPAALYLGRFDKIPVERLKSCSMKLTQIRRFWHVFVVLTCCCIPIAFASSAAGAHFSFLGWIQLSPTNSPPARSYLAMTYDPISGKVIAFGGFDGTGYLNDTGPMLFPD